MVGSYGAPWGYAEGRPEKCIGCTEDNKQMMMNVTEDETGDSIRWKAMDLYGDT